MVSDRTDYNFYFVLLSGLAYLSYKFWGILGNIGELRYEKTYIPKLIKP